MVAANYSRAYALVRKYEGGNDDDPHDPGGRTSRGIIQSEYDRYRAAIGQPKKDVWTASEDEIASIYRSGYWDKQHCDQIQSGVDIVVWDAGVNSGVAQSAKWAQRGANAQGKALTVDGKLGPATIEALNACEPVALINSMCDQRLAMLKGLPTWGRYGKGWTSRVVDLRKAALALAGKPSSPSEGKGLSIRDLQAALNVFGYGLTADGKLGPKTDAALNDFEKRLAAFKAARAA
ncbi:glycosyl hydrolase 108 family protein [Aquabacter sp. CN5-332]|uniref:glycosyl hydrolase 108 family protein n=1 Tax=Aquabacter sp. CN5-332 TaxID=3156608 RepID=UPI0032B59207